MKKLTTVIALLSVAPCTLVWGDQVFNDDVIMRGSACTGLDCSNGENFGFDTLRLKENNVRIRFFDTSTSASFPSNDWQITANDSSNGGANKFSIDDIDNSRTPFTIEASAPSHSLYVDDGGRIGLGTDMPVVEVHMKDGDTPTYRLEQDGSSGFAPQTWDVAGNETNFFVRDVTNGSSLPFKIQPSAPNNSVFIASDGDVGVGTSSPSAAFHVNRTTGGVAELLRLANNAGSYITMENTGSGDDWFITHENQNEGRLIIDSEVDNVLDGFEMSIDKDGNMEITGTLTTAGTTCGMGGCDLVFKQGYQLVPIEEHAASMWKNSHLPAVGPTVEREPFNLTEKTGGILHELEIAHIYIERLHHRLKKREDQLMLMEKRLAQLEERLAD